MIDPLIERLISFSEASDLFPRRRRGRKPSISCVYRWTVNGCRGIILESIQAGGTRCTSREAVARFMARLSGREGARRRIRKIRKCKTSPDRRHPRR